MKGYKSYNSEGNIMYERNLCSNINNCDGLITYYEYDENNIISRKKEGCDNTGNACNVLISYNSFGKETVYKSGCDENEYCTGHIQFKIYDDEGNEIGINSQCNNELKECKYCYSHGVQVQCPTN